MNNLIEGELVKCTRHCPEMVSYREYSPSLLKMFDKVHRITNEQLGILLPHLVVFDKDDQKMASQGLFSLSEALQSALDRE